MTENENADQSSLAPDDGDRERLDWVSNPPKDYRVSQLKEDVAKVLAANDRLYLAPVESGGTGNTRARIIAPTFPETEQVREELESEGFVVSHKPLQDDGVEILVHGRETDLTDLHSGDLVHVNDRGGPWRVTDQAIKTGFTKYGKPHAADVVKLEHADRDDVNPYAIVRWYSSEDPDLYTKTVDTESGVKENVRWKKYEDVDRLARLGPARCYKIQDQNEANFIRNRINKILDGKYGEDATADMEGEFGRDYLNELADRLMFGTRIIPREDHRIAVHAANIHRNHDSTEQVLQITPIHAGHPEFTEVFEIPEDADQDQDQDADLESEVTAEEESEDVDGATFVCEDCENEVTATMPVSTCVECGGDMAPEGEESDSSSSEDTEDTEDVASAVDRGPIAADAQEPEDTEEPESEDTEGEDTEDGEDSAEYVCDTCGAEFQNRFRYSKQSAMCADPDEDYTCEGEPDDE